MLPTGRPCLTHLLVSGSGKEQRPGLQEVVGLELGISSPLQSTSQLPGDLGTAASSTGQLQSCGLVDGRCPSPSWTCAPQVQQQGLWTMRQCPCPPWRQAGACLLLDVSGRVSSRYCAHKAYTLVLGKLVPAHRYVCFGPHGSILHILINCSL